MDWANSESPALEEFEAMARAAFAGLPAEFRALAGGVVFAVQEFPDEEVVRDMDLHSEFDILGLFQGPDLAGQDAGAMSQTMIFLYRRPILDYWAEHRETLGGIVRHVLIHEIGHHFGLSDDDMDAIENRA
ncbi:MAG TPA: metallopeptidase family protein [Rhizomicrobium sp.]|nr:metallopeptidase family protein [Rhizomicrobium sp.]